MKKKPFQVASMLFCPSYKRVAICLIISALMVLGAGCRLDLPLKRETIDASLSPKALKSYQAAVATFQIGDYDGSAKQFSEIRAQTSDKRLARLALYGLALSKLMAAESPESYERALQLWKNWVNIAPAIDESENAILFDPVVKEKMLYSNIPTAAQKMEEPAAGGTVSNWLFVRTKQEMDRLREKLAVAKALDKKRLTRIQSLQKEIGRLKRQIKALETIDQKIQEKKNAIPSAE